MPHRSCTLVLLMCGVASSAAVDQKTVWSGVYSKAQAQRGQAIYAKWCVSCHGPTLQGIEQAAPLAGPAFAANWDGRTLGALFDVMRRSMPGDDPGTLTVEQNADVLAYILNVGKFPAGKAALPADRNALDTIMFATKR
jgi:S-disulfanyl-L-cysteine oxidoreductase SoxD